MLSKKRDAWLTCIVCSLTGIFVFIETFGYPIVKSQGFGRGPGFYPQVLAGTLIGLGLLTLIQAIWREKPGSSALADQPGTVPALSHWPVAALIFLSVASIIAMEYVGFLLSGFVLTFLSVILIKASLKGRCVVPGLIYSIGMMALVYVVFEVFVGVQLPGASFFK